MIQSVVLRDENSKLHNLKKVKDSVYDSIRKIYVSNWLWIYADSAVFFNFEIWSELDNAYLNKIIKYKDTYFKVIEINPSYNIRYS